MILDPDVKCTPGDVGRYVAIDCEMVGVGPVRTVTRYVFGKARKQPETESSLARVSIVNFHGAVVLDAFVRQKEAVTDYRTAVSGVRPEDLNGPDTLPFDEVQRKVAEILKDRNLVGHAVQNDLKVNPQSVASRYPLTSS